MKIHTLDMIMAAGIAAAVLLSGFGEFSRRAETVTGEVLRLHIPANSDSGFDQSIKLALRDAVLKEFGAQLSDSASLAQAQSRVRELLPQIERFCCDFLSDHGADYSAKAELTQMYFTTREYDSVTLPAGDYSALRITLGSGEGHNWWCIMFPPLCLPCVSEREESAESEEASPEENEGVLASFEQPQQIKVKFAVYEWLKKLLERK